MIDDQLAGCKVVSIAEAADVGDDADCQDNHDVNGDGYPVRMIAQGHERVHVGLGGV